MFIFVIGNVCHHLFTGKKLTFGHLHSNNIFLSPVYAQNKILISFGYTNQPSHLWLLEYGLRAKHKVQIYKIIQR